MTKQEQIDKICTWAWGEPIFCSTITGHKAWRDGDDTVLSTAFNPFESASDCARVMDEVVNRLEVQEIGYKTRFLHSPEANYLAWIVADQMCYGDGKTECEAKMNALLEAIGKE